MRVCVYVYRSITIHSFPRRTRYTRRLISSPRTLLTPLNFPTTTQVLVSSFEEDLPKESVQNASEYATLTATHKALDVAAQLTHNSNNDVDLIISADTVVECQGHILEKPSDHEDARKMLELLSGRRHYVHTGVALLTPTTATATATTPTSGWDVHSFVETTTVVFDSLPPGEIEAYIGSGEPWGKAGSYGIQGRAAPFVKSIEGCYFNVVGLPLSRVSREIQYLIGNGRMVLDA